MIQQRYQLLRVNQTTAAWLGLMVKICQCLTEQAQALIKITALRAWLQAWLQRVQRRSNVADNADLDRVAPAQICLLYTSRCV